MPTSVAETWKHNSPPLAPNAPAEQVRAATERGTRDAIGAQKDAILEHVAIGGLSAEDSAARTNLATQLITGLNDYAQNKIATNLLPALQPELIAKHTKLGLLTRIICRQIGGKAAFMQTGPRLRRHIDCATVWIRQRLAGVVGLHVSVELPLILV